MLVKLYELPEAFELQRQLGLQGTTVRRAMAYEKAKVIAWVEQAFSQSAPGWKSECDVAFARSPIACHIAISDGAIIGFTCHDVTARNVLGPIGVGEGSRGTGIGSLLLVTALQAMHAAGYSYAIIGQAGAAGFFAKVAGAIEIPGSTAGFYPQPLAR